MIDSNVEASKNQIKTTSPNHYPVFPLPIFLLAGGMQRLRIFEPKYVSMIANSNQTDGFVIALYQEDKPLQVPDWGTHVQIVDFDQGEDGILVVDVLAVDMVELSDFEHQIDGLLIAKSTSLLHWSSMYGSTIAERDTFDVNHQLKSQLASVLKGIFNEHKPLNDLYKKQYFDYSEWVCARLLEIIPLTLIEKERFVQQLEFAQLTELLSSLCEKEE